LPAFERHVFVCHNTRPADAPRPSCTTDGKSETVYSIANADARLPAWGRRCGSTKSGCLDQCSMGRRWWFITMRCVVMGRCSLRMRRRLWRSNLVADDRWNATTNGMRPARLASPERCRLSAAAGAISLRLRLPHERQDVIPMMSCRRRISWLDDATATGCLTWLLISVLANASLQSEFSEAFLDVPSSYPLGFKAS